MQDSINALVIDQASPYRAHYVSLGKDGEVKHRRDGIIGWAAVGMELWPVRVESQTRREVLVGSDADPEREALMGVLTAGENLSDIPDADERIRQMVLADVESADVEE